MIRREREELGTYSNLPWGFGSGIGKVKCDGRFVEKSESWWGRGLGRAILGVRSILDEDS
jgi:hypothetical protein